MKRVTPAAAATAALAGSLAPGWGSPAGADFIWNGGGADALWTTGANWAGGAAPPFDVQDRLVFGSTGGVVQSPDAAENDWTNIFSISFTGADASLNVMGTGTVTLADADGITEITNDSTFTQTFDISIIATGEMLILDAMLGDLILCDDIDLSDAVGAGDGVVLSVRGDFDTTLLRAVAGAAGSLVKDGAGTLVLDAASTYGGGTTLMAGTIVLGDDGALGTGALLVAGDGNIESDDDARRIGNAVTIADGVTLTFSGGNDLNLNGIVSGDGALLVNTDTVDDRLILSRNNTYGGGTTLVQGTIVLGANNALGTGDLTVTGSGAIQSNSDVRNVATNITIEAGATLSFTGSSDLRLRGVIDGDGALIVNPDEDADRLILTGTNTYTGGTLLSSGTLVLGNDSALGTGTLSLLGDATIESNDDERVVGNDVFLNPATTLTVAGVDDLELSGAIGGDGGLTLDGDMTLTLSGDSTYLGDTNVNAGTLLLAGSITSAVNVNDGGTFGGDGRMTGLLTNLSGGTVAPGAEPSSIGTLAVDGDYDQQDGSRLSVTLGADDGSSDLLDVTGNVTLAAGSTIAANVSGDGYIRNGQTFTVIQAGGTITDNGAAVVTESATVTISFDPDSDVSDGTYELILFRAADAYGSAADAGNNRAIGAALDSLQPLAEADPMGDVGELLGRLDTFGSADYNTALSQLSPEPYNVLSVTGIAGAEAFALTQSSYLSARRLGLESAAAVVQAPAARPGSLGLSFDDPQLLAAAFDRIQPAAPHSSPDAGPAAEPKRFGNYVRLQGVFVDQDPTTNRSGFESSSLGGQFGIDWNVTSDLIIGAAVGYLYTDASITGGLGDLTDQALRAGPYLSWTTGNFYLDGSATFAWHFYGGDRAIPALSLTAESDYDGYDIDGYLGAGYHLEVARDVFLTPTASVQYTHFEIDGFTETGAGGANLTVAARDADSLRSRLGLNLSAHVDWGWSLFPYVFAGWEHEFADDDPIESAFAAGGNPFLIDTGSRDENAAFYGGGVNALLKENVSAFVRVEGVIGDDSDAVAFSLGVGIAF
jgi:outer membrane autotransporter protein